MASFTDLYPERRGGVISPTTIQVTPETNPAQETLEILLNNLDFTLLQRLTGSSGSPQHLRVTCEQNLVANVENMPMVKTLLSALKASGCPVDLKRHLVSCWISENKSYFKFRFARCVNQAPRCSMRVATILHLIRFL